LRPVDAILQKNPDSEGQFARTYGFGTLFFPTFTPKVPFEIAIRRARFCLRRRRATRAFVRKQNLRLVPPSIRHGVSGNFKNEGTSGDVHENTCGGDKMIAQSAISPPDIRSYCGIEGETNGTMAAKQRMSPAF